MTTTNRAAFRYFGGKHTLAPWVISHFPAHKSYVELCGGAGSVLLLKSRSPLETLNDLDGRVVNFFRVLRDCTDELIRRIELTPWARDEYRECKQPTNDPIEAARRFYMLAQMGIAASGRSSSGMRMVYDVHGGVPASINATARHLLDIAGRLRGVQIENKDALELALLTDREDTLFYFDPPYLSETRSTKHQYRIENGGNDFHIAAARLLNSVRGYVVVSGYACSLYTELYEANGWQRKDTEVKTNGNTNRIESIWLSPRTTEALAGGSMQFGLFAGMEAR